MRLTPGSRLGPYEVLSALGAGGMAEVYRVRDTRLGREAALKIVNAALAGDPELLRRFEQEARLAGSLNHPNLAAVYDVGIHEGSPYFISELLRGESLRSRLSRGRISVDSALAWAAQVAQGLAAAHARGILHRDVKPENVFVSSDGQIKLFDFGIAKLVEGTRADAAHGVLDETAAVIGQPTQTGSILGTPAYMSPEQVRGDRVDVRTDVFSLGATLYEMLSGRRPFARGSAFETAHAILHDDPARLPNVPYHVAQVVLRCLAKDPDVRFQSARDLAFALEMLRSDVAPYQTTHHPGAFRFLTRRGAWALGLAAVAVAAGLALARHQLFGPPPFPSATERVTFRLAYMRSARFTPDGHVAFTSTWDGRPEELYERNLATASLQPLGLKNMVLAAVSPKGELAVVLSPRTPISFIGVRGTLARVSFGGGTPRAVAEEVEAADWSPSGELAIVRRTNGTRSLEFPIGKTLFKTSGTAWIGNLRVSPRGDLLAFILHPMPYLDAGEVVVIDLDGRRRQASQSWALAEGIAWSPQNDVWFTAGEFARNKLQAMPVGGKERTVYSSLAPIVLQDIAPDGSALLLQEFASSEIVLAAEGEGTQRSVSWNDLNWNPSLSADGRVILFSAFGPRRETFTLLANTGGASPQILGDGYGLDLSQDGKWALLASPDFKTLTVVPTGAGSPRTVPLSGFEFRNTRWLGGVERVVSVARANTDPDFRLYSINVTNGELHALSEPGLDPIHLELSPDQAWAATLDAAQRPVLHPLDGGASVTLTELEPGSAPAGWASKSELWFARTDVASPAVIQLARFDIRRHLVVEERRVSPANPNGTAGLWSVRVTADGKSVAYVHGRVVGHLYLLRGIALRDR